MKSSKVPDLDKRKITKVIKLMSDGLLYLSGFLLIISIIAVAIAWNLAYKYGWIPEEWGIKFGNHGPWRRFYPGRYLVMYAISLPIWGFFLAIGSLLIKRSRAGIWLILLSFILWFIIFYTHYWLID